MTGASRVDVAIIGDGAAGCSAALSLLKTGCSSMIIAPAGRKRRAVGESLSPSAGAILDELGIAVPFAGVPQRSAGISYAAWDAPFLVPGAPGMGEGTAGQVLDRPSFERMLLAAAAPAATATVDGTIRSASRSGAGWSLQLADGGEVDARHVIDCSGRAAVVARQLARCRRVDRQVAVSCIIQQGTDDVEPSAATLVEAVEDGWWFATLLPDRRMSLMFFTDPDLVPRGLSHDAGLWRSMIGETLFLRRWIESADFVITEAPRLSCAATAWLETASGPGWAAAGDAAAAFDPLSSHGLVTALWSGRRAALAAAAALRGQPEPSPSYAEVMRQAIREFLQQRQRIYARAARFHDCPFWQRRRTPPLHSANLPNLFQTQRLPTSIIARHVAHAVPVPAA